MTGRLGEFERIARFFRPLAADFPGALELGDDAALIDVPPGETMVATTDAMVEGIHFLAGEDPARLARKALRVNLSDLAAMGARPLAYLLALALPGKVGEDWLATFAAGLGEDQRRFGLALAGGDSVSTPGPITVAITALGRVPAAEALRRGGAGIGDPVFVSGTIGDGALGLRAARGELGGLAAGDLQALADRYHLPTPRVEAGLRLRGLATAAADVSDGLVQDLGHICAASGVGARLRADRVPLSTAARLAVAADRSLAAVALAGGDDYELVFTVPRARSAEVESVAAGLDLPLTEIGEIVAGAGIEVVDADGRPVELTAGWRHF